MAAVWTFMALLGLEAVFQLVPWAYALARVVGACYLLYIAWGMWRGARNKLKPTVKPARQAFRQGILINMTNPKSVLFAAAVLIVIFPADMTLAGKGLVVLNHLAIEVLFYAALAVGMSTNVVSNGYLRAKLYIDRAASIVLGTLGLRLLAGRGAIPGSSFRDQGSGRLSRRLASRLTARSSSVVAVRLQVFP